MKRLKKVVFAGAVTLGLLGGAATCTESANAENHGVAHPHPEYLDTWKYGVTKEELAYSYYYLEAPVRLGSEAWVRDFKGKERAHARRNYGWARAEATKQWYWIRAEAFYGWYDF